MPFVPYLIFLWQCGPRELYLVREKSEVAVLTGAHECRAQTNRFRRIRVLFGVRYVGVYILDNEISISSRFLIHSVRQFVSEFCIASSPFFTFDMSVTVTNIRGYKNL